MKIPGKTDVMLLWMLKGIMNDWLENVRYEKVLRCGSWFIWGSEVIL